MKLRMRATGAAALAWIVAVLVGSPGQAADRDDAGPAMSEQLALFDMPQAEVSIASTSSTDAVAATRPPPPTPPLYALVAQASQDYGVDRALLLAVVHAESAGDVFAVSRAGAVGLAQIMPATASAFGVRASQLFDPIVNLRVAAADLRKLELEYGGDLTRVLAAYNAGEGAVARFGGVPPYRETRAYVRRVIAAMRRAQATAGFASAMVRHAG